MNGEPQGGPRHRRRGLKSLLWELSIGALVALIPVIVAALLREAPAGAAAASDQTAENYRRDLHSYFWGIGLALVLTLVPFALVYWKAMSPFSLAIAIGAFALVQMVVHFRFFLHINPPRQKRDDLYLILFSSLVVVVMVSGTIWIMTNLAARMM